MNYFERLLRAKSIAEFLTEGKQSFLRIISSKLYNEATNVKFQRERKYRARNVKFPTRGANFSYRSSRWCPCNGFEKRILVAFLLWSHRIKWNRALAAKRKTGVRSSYRVSQEIDNSNRLSAPNFLFGGRVDQVQTIFLTKASDL